MTQTVIPTFTNRDISNARYSEENAFKDILKSRELFKTPKSQGGFGYDSMAGVYYAHSTKCQACPHCGYTVSGSIRNAYAVYSYRTIMYLFCSTCGYEYCNASWYSKITRELQQVLASVYPEYHKALAAQIEKEEKARKRWKSDKARGLLNTTSRHQHDINNMLDWYVSRPDVDSTSGREITHAYHKSQPDNQEVYDRDVHNTYAAYRCE